MVVSATEGDGAKTRVARSNEAVEREGGTPAMIPRTACLMQEAAREYYANERLHPRYRRKGVMGLGLSWGRKSVHGARERRDGTTPLLPSTLSRLTVGQLEETETNDAVFVWLRREWRPGPEAVGLK